MNFISQSPIHMFCFIHCSSINLRNMGLYGGMECESSDEKDREIESKEERRRRRENEAVRDREREIIL